MGMSSTSSFILLLSIPLQSEVQSSPQQKINAQPASNQNHANDEACNCGEPPYRPLYCSQPSESSRGRVRIETHKESVTAVGHANQSPQAADPLLCNHNA